MPVQAPQWLEFLSCPICYNEFEPSLRRPISLGCGHTFCRSCLSKLQRKQCPFDQTSISIDISQLPENYALLQLVGGTILDKPVVSTLQGEAREHYMAARKYVEELALYLKPLTQSGNSASQGSALSRPMQRKLVTLINSQLLEDEGRTRAMRAARSLGERSVTELILQHQNPQQLSANLWAAVRARGCQFLGPAMQEEVLKLVLLALEDGSALSRKVLVMFVVQRLAPHFPQASKTSIGHVVQLLYRASCFKVSKRDGDSSLMQLKEEFQTYEALRREHDAQIVQIATEAGLRIAPEQWSSLLYGDTAHKSHMQSIIDKLQTPQSFAQSVQELVIALQRTGDPGSLSVLRPHLELLAAIDPNPDSPIPTWEELENALEGAIEVVKGLVNFIENFGNRRLHEEKQILNVKYKTNMCRDLTQRGSCPRGANCSFAHSQEEMERYRAKNKKNSGHHSLLSGSSGTGGSVTNGTKPQAPGKLPSGMYTTNSYVRSSAVSSIPDTSGYEKEAVVCGSSATVVKSNISSGTQSKPLHTLNPDSPIFEPMAVSTVTPDYSKQGSISVICHGSPSHYQLQGTVLCPEIFQSTPVQPHTQLLGVIPAAIATLSRGHISFHNTYSVPRMVAKDSEGRPIVASTTVCSGVNMTARERCSYLGNTNKGMDEHEKHNLVLQPLAALQKRKQEILTKLEQVQVSRYGTDNWEGSVSTFKGGIGDKKCYLNKNGTDEGIFKEGFSLSNKTSYYSPWTSADIFCYTSRATALSGSSTSTTDAEKYMQETGRGGHGYTDEDQFIPFDPPFVSKYGPISRKIRPQHMLPIQVSVAQIGALTNPTSVMRHPLSAATAVPSIFTPAPQGFAVPFAFIPTGPEQFVPVGAVMESSPIVVPLNMECEPLSTLHTTLAAHNICQVGTQEMEQLQNTVENFQISSPEDTAESHRLKEELWAVEQTIQHKERVLSSEEGDYNDIEKQWLQQLEEEENSWNAADSSKPDGHDHCSSTN
ncbi:roquin-1-like isoform X1 [Limulus polyphemus]|uniref:RING-type E3 ubiquitin transferase n=3 Tax=Limulus polyphemus TaxID=6850 RepID=A0ABM1SV50_LIMPO|nr:roquin-1-like isoform X1 [Limulus polyphemus]